MEFKGFLKSFFMLPADILSGLTKLLLGSDNLDERGDPKFDKQGSIIRNPGVFGYIAQGFLYLTKGIGNFVSHHKTAIATAFWASLAVGGAAALTVAFWPVALAAVVGFSVAGFSIAALVGTGFVAQVSAVAALAAATTSVAVYAAATVINAISGLHHWFTGHSKVAGGYLPIPNSIPPASSLYSNSNLGPARRREQPQSATVPPVSSQPIIQPGAPKTVPNSVVQEDQDIMERKSHN